MLVVEENPEAGSGLVDKPSRIDLGRGEGGGGTDRDLPVDLKVLPEVVGGDGAVVDVRSGGRTLEDVDLAADGELPVHPVEELDILFLPSLASFVEEAVAVARDHEPVLVGIFRGEFGFDGVLSFGRLGALGGVGPGIGCSLLGFGLADIALRFLQRRLGKSELVTDLDDGVEQVDGIGGVAALERLLEEPEAFLVVVAVGVEEPGILLPEHGILGMLEQGGLVLITRLQELGL